MTRNQRLRKFGEFAIGRRIANRQHVSASNLEVCRMCWLAIDKRTRATIRHGRTRDALHALFLGALTAHKANRALFIQWRF